jgi:hypothetical protein
MTSLVPSRSAFVAVLLSAALVPSLRAQDEKVAELRRAIYEGTDVLRRIFHVQKYQPLDTFDALDAEPEQTIVVLLGGANPIQQIPRGLRRYVERGGSVLIASHFRPDSPTEAALADVTGVTITGQTMVLASEFRLDGYQGRAHCPYLESVGLTNPLFRDPRGADAPLKVVVNYPSCLMPLPDGPQFLPLGVKQLARLPVECFPTPGHIGEPFTGLFAVGVQVEKGRVLLLADHRLFLNRMMYPDDTGNVEFAENCLKYLNPDGKPKKLLFVDRGTINADFDVPLQPLPKLPDDIVDKGVNVLNHLLADAEPKMTRFEEENGFNRKFWELMAAKRITPGDVAKWAVLVGSLLFLTWGLFRVGGSRYRLAASTPLLSRFVSRHRPESPLAVRRQRELLAGDNLYEPARTLARATFATTGMAPPGDGQRAPRIEATVGWWRGWRLRRLTRRLWALAFDAVPQAVPKSAWPILQRELDELKVALATGKVRIVQVGS